MRNNVMNRPTSLIETLFNDEAIHMSYGTGIDIYKDETGYRVDIEMPGFKKEAINVQFTGDVLSVSAEHAQEETENRDFFYRSRKFTNVKKQIRFADVDESKVDGRYENGVLHLVLPRKTKEEIVNRIDIK